MDVCDRPAGQPKAHVCPQNAQQVRTKILLFTNGFCDRSGRGELSDIVMANKELPVEIQFIEHIIKNFTSENEVVCDPMMRYGLVADSAIKLKRRFIGIEMSTVCFESAKEQIAELV